MNKLTYILAITAGILISSCDEDKGQYDYADDILEVQAILKNSYGVKKEKTPFDYTITPEIQIPEEYKKNLSYEWYVSTKSSQNKGDLLGTDETLTIEMDPTQANMPTKYYIRLYITDKTTEAVTFQYSTLEVINPFTFSWMVLHETDGHAEIGAVEYMGGNMLVTPNAYTQEKGTSLTGKPLSLSCGQSAVNWSNGLYQAQSICYLSTTNEEESGIINPGNSFDLYAKWGDILHPTQKDAYFTLDDIQYSLSSSGGYGSLMISNGKVFRQRMGSPVMYLMAPLDADKQEMGDYYISKMASGPNAGIGFDETGHRFLNLGLQTGDYWYEMNYAESPKDGGRISFMPSNENNAFDPSQPIPANQKIVAMFNGYHYGISGIAPWQRYTIYAYTIDEFNSYVYPFQCRGLTGSDPSLPNYYKFVTPEGVNEATPFTTGTRFSNILFYAIGNKVYRLDATSGKYLLIYQHENPSAQISTLKMACEGGSFDDDNDEIGTEDYGIPYNRCLGAAFNLPDGTGELVVLQLGTNGRILEEESKYPSTQVHKGFGPIKSIVFI